MGFKAKRLYLDWGRVLREHVDYDGTMDDAEYKRTWYFPPHACRKVSASLLRGAGVPIETCRALLGHLTPAMTEHYTSPLFGTQMDATRSLETAMTSVDAPLAVVEKWMEGIEVEYQDFTPGYDDGLRMTQNAPGPTKNAPESP